MNTTTWVLIISAIIGILSTILSGRIRSRTSTLILQVLVIGCFVAMGITDFFNQSNEALESQRLFDTTAKIEDKISILDAKVQEQLQELDSNLLTMTVMNDTLAELGRTTELLVRKRQQGLINYEATTQMLEGQYRTEFDAYRKTIRNDAREKIELNQRIKELINTKDSFIVKSEYLQRQKSFLLERTSLTWKDSSDLDMIRLETQSEFHELKSAQLKKELLSSLKSYNEIGKRIDTLTLDEKLMELKMHFLLDDISDSLYNQEMQERIRQMEEN